MRETITTITTNNNIQYVISVKDKSNLKYHIIEDSVCYITRIDKNKFFSRKETIQFSYSGIDLDHNKVKKELKKKYSSQGRLPYGKFIYFPHIVDNLITSLEAQPDIVFDLMKDFDESTWEEKAMIIYQLYDSAGRIRKYEENNYPSNKSTVINKINKLQSITDSLEEL